MKYTKISKRLGACLLALLLTTGILPFGVLADDFTELGNNGALWARALAGAGSTFTGSGTEADPYVIASLADAEEFRDQVNEEGNRFEGKYISLTADLEIPADWVPVGTVQEGTDGNPSLGVEMFSVLDEATAFCGTFQGNGHTITIASGGLTFFGCLGTDAYIQDLKIYGPRIAGNGIVEYYCREQKYTLDNITLVSGTHTLKSGFVSGYGNEPVTIKNSTVESGVVIGYNHDQSKIGSFGGDFNGFIQNCESYATVYGVDFVGGIVGCKGQSMRDYTISGCTFGGIVSATGKYAGGISGGGYGGTGWGTAVNAAEPTITNCLVTGSIRGAEGVGGILGAEHGIAQAWTNRAGTISNNSFTGNISMTGTSKKIGAIIGYLKSLNKNLTIEGNSYSSTCGAERPFGVVSYVDTSHDSPTPVEGTTYVNSVTNRPSQQGMTESGHNRTDDPLGRDIANLAAPMDARTLSVTGYKTTYFVGEVFTLEGAAISLIWDDGTITNLNAVNLTWDKDAFDSTKTNQNQTIRLYYGSLYADITVKVTANTVKTLEISEGYEDEYWVGGKLDLEGATITATWEDGTTSHPAQGDLTFSGKCTADGYLNEAGTNLTITATFGGKTAALTVTVKQPTVDSLSVSLSDSFKTTYVVGESFSLSGATITAHWTNGEDEVLDADDVEVSGFNGNKAGTYTVTVEYEGITKTLPKTVKVEALSDSNSITVTFSLLGDTVHGGEDEGYTGTVHTLSSGNLTTWISAKSYSIPKDSTVKYLFEKALTEAGISWKNPSGNYVSEVNGLSQLDNGPDSGWMYTLNGSYPNYGVSEQKLEDGDVVVFHYSDDHTQEDGSTGSTTTGTGSSTGTGTTAGTTVTADDVIKLIDAIGETITEASKEAIDAARTAYDKLSAADKEKVTNYDKLLEAERKLDELLGISPAQNITLRLPSTGDYLVSTVSQPVLGSIGGDWVVLGLSRAEYPVPEGYFEGYLESVEQTLRESGGILHEKKYSDYSRVILALTAIGQDPRNIAGYNLLAPLADFEQVCWQGINGPIWALLALDSANYPVPEAIPGKTRTTRAGLIRHILDSTVEGGGWSLGNTADVDLTAMAIQALAPYYDTDPEVKEAVELGLTLLSRMQSDRGSFSNGTEMTSESCAQVIVALTALGIDPATDERFLKNGRSILDALNDFATEEGGYAHILSGEVNGMATEQAYYALVAYERLLDGKTSLFDMTDIQDFGGDLTQNPEEESTQQEAESNTEKPVSLERQFPWWAVAVLGCGMIGAIVLFLNRKRLF